MWSDCIDFVGDGVVGYTGGSGLYCWGFVAFGVCIEFYCDDVAGEF